MNTLHTGTRATGLAAATLIASLGLTPMAQASTAEDSSYVVDATGLDLQTMAGVAALYDKLRYAAESVCRLDVARGYAPRRQARRCVGDTLEAVVAKVGGSLLREQHYAEMRQVRRAPSGELSTATAAAGR